MGVCLTRRFSAGPNFDLYTERLKAMFISPGEFLYNGVYAATEVCFALLPGSSAMACWLSVGLLLGIPTQQNNFGGLGNLIARWVM